jgi:hypothetical protein
MADNSDRTTYCNARLKGNGDLEKRDPDSEHAGDGYCKRHSGGGRCRMHGGTEDIGRPIETGLYSSRREELREKLGAAQGVDDPGNLRREVDVLRALKAEYLERIDGPVDGEDIDNITDIDAEIRRMTDTAHQMMHRDAPSEEEIERLITGFADILQQYIPDESTRADAIDELEAIISDGRRTALPNGRATD